jgi:hypothetical protein
MWSAAHGPAIVALICGLALAPLLLSVAWLILTSLLRFIADRKLLGGRLVMRHGSAPDSAARPAIAVRGGAPERRRAASTVRRMRIRRGSARGPLRSEHAAREAADAGHASPAERVAA